MLIFDAPEPDAGLGWGLHLGVPQSEPHTAVYYRLGGLIDQCCEVISQLDIDDVHKLIYGVLVDLLCSWHVTQHLDGKACSISDLGLPSIIEDPVILKHELIVKVHLGCYFQICPSKTMSGISTASCKFFWNARYFE